MMTVARKNDFSVINMPLNDQPDAERKESEHEEKKFVILKRDSLRAEICKI